MLPIHTMASHVATIVLTSKSLHPTTGPGMEQLAWAPDSALQQLMNDWADEPATPPAPSAAPAMQPHCAQRATRKTPGRTRGPALADRIYKAQMDLDARAATLQRAALQHFLLREREAMLELVLAVKDRQADRIREVRGGLSFNPLAAAGMTAADLVSATPAEMFQRFSRKAAEVGARLAAVAPLLDRCPDLLTPAAPLPRCAVHELAPCNVITRVLGGIHVQPRDDTEAASLRDLVALALHLEDMSLPFVYGFVMRPQLMLLSGSSSRVLPRKVVEDPGTQPTWEQVASLVDVHLGNVSGEPAVVQGPSPTPSVVAAEAHWRHVVRCMRLSDHQRLQAAMLADIVSSLAAGIAAQRASVASSLTQLHSPPQWQLRAESAQGLLLDELHATLDKDRCLYILAGEVLARHIFLPLQMGLALVNSQPYVVDMFGMLHAAAEECTPEVQARLATAAGQG